MGILTAIGLLFGGGSSSTPPAAGLADDIGKVAGTFIETPEQRDNFAAEIMGLVQKSTSDARVASVVEGGGIVAQLANGVNTLMHPWLAVIITGAMMGWWGLNIDAAPASLQRAFWAVVVYYFGDALLNNGLPALIAALKAKA